MRGGSGVVVEVVAAEMKAVSIVSSGHLGCCWVAAPLHPSSSSSSSEPPRPRVCLASFTSTACTSLTSGPPPAAACTCAHATLTRQPAGSHR